MNHLTTISHQKARALAGSFFPRIRARGVMAPATVGRTLVWVVWSGSYYYTLPADPVLDSPNWRHRVNP